MDYKTTLNLPKTEFPMKANLAKREPEVVERWDGVDLYRAILKKNEGKPRFILHDGPPYANGHLHLGHVMNKTLKDIVVRMKNMSGFQSPYLPGWDCHGLPIELQVVKKMKSKAKELSPAELRKECRKYADQFIDIQREEFRRLGVMGEWKTPYRTMDFSYEAQIAREFGKVVEKGHVYRSRKAVHWCIHCRTALAEAEIEYGNHRSPSIYVSYPVIAGWEELGLPETKEEDRFAVIWTTTPWTLPASMAIAYHERESYVVVEKNGESGRYIVAESLIPAMNADLGPKSSLKVVKKIGPGSGLKKFRAQHPFLKREIPFFPAEHVTMETGTGLVHTAPGHGQEDYELGRKHGIDIYSPVEKNGRFEKEVEHFGGLNVFKANPEIVDHLKASGRLFAPLKEMEHSYPHCWRCKHPVIFRATEQWFLSLDQNDLRKKALEEIDRVQWIPQWGRERIYGMIENRPDWCLSRQRIWGVPVIAFECLKCHEHLLSSEVISHVADQFEKEGSDIWYTRKIKELLPPNTQCSKCGHKEFEKGNDILDVWFDSGVSHAAVLEPNDQLGWPCDLYLEGSDQHRGWFHSSLLEGVATRGKSPYRSVITHGFFVDGEGKKMSKSLGNYISPQETIKEKGAEMLRLWVATEDYRGDVRVSKEILDRVTESYRRIRNTARFCLGNLSDFSPDEDRVPMEKWPREIDHWAADRLTHLIERVRSAYQKYEFHIVVQAINEFCVVDLSSLYLDVAKDCFYCEDASGVKRRSGQTVLFDTVSSLARMLAPILPFTAEEIWDHLPKFKGKLSSVHLTEFPEMALKTNDELNERWKKLLLIRAEVSKALEPLRKEKKIGQSLQAQVEIVVPEPYRSLLGSYREDLSSLWIVSRAKLVDSISAGLEPFTSSEIEGLLIGAAPIEGERCERCWTYTEDVGAVSKHPSLCKRCAEVVNRI